VKQQIDFSLIKIVPPAEEHHNFAFQVKKAAMGPYITQIWGWDENAQRDWAENDWINKPPQIILYGDEPIGTIRIIENDDHISLERFYILPEFQNKGIGSYLIQEAFKRADSKNVPTKLCVLKINPAKELYLRNGFRAVSEDEYLVNMERPARGPLKPGKQYKAVIFDLFGTLVDSYSLLEYTSALRETSSLLKIPHDDFARLWNETSERRTTGVFKSLEENLEHICRELNIPVNNFDIRLAKMVRYDFITLTMTPRRYAVELLSQLKTEGYKVGLISNCSSEAPVIWPTTTFAPFFDVTIFSSTAGMQKPDPRIYHIACERMGVQPGDCLYVGDGDNHELTGAAAAGLHPALIREEKKEEDNPAVRSEPEIDDYPCPAIDSLPEVLDVLAGVHEI
jgi:putative hydrolase of the HAD superfamily